MTMASITVLGRLGRDPEARSTAGGRGVTSFSIAVDDGNKDNKHTTWFRCNAWEKTGETIMKFFKKGDSIIVTGTIGTREWVDKEGANREVWEVTVRQFGFAGGKKEEASQGRQDDYI